jgi:hypothetical protein
VPVGRLGRGVYVIDIYDCFFYPEVGDPLRYDRLKIAFIPTMG